MNISPEFEKYLPNLPEESNLPQLFQDYKDHEIKAGFVEIEIKGRPVLLMIQFPTEIEKEVDEFVSKL